MEIADIALKDIWLASGIIVGFQVTFFLWRLSREARMRERKYPTWFPPSDVLNLVSMAIFVIGVFILPATTSISPYVVKRCFATAALLFLGYPFALAGHYELYTPGEKGKQPYCTIQEWVVIEIIATLVLMYVIFATQ